MSETTNPRLDTSAGEFTLQESRFRRGHREWAVLHTGAVLSREDESRVIGQEHNRLPYGVALWPSAIALVHEIITRSDEIRGRRILELGAGTGIPGIVAAARVVTPVARLDVRSSEVDSTNRIRPTRSDSRRR